ncbi:MAG: class I SAM-dependent methyltransferase [Candidatus Aminicenantes bacterium]|nr:class I SAM-dependent methyltransferase [Candidatus Aminicenantes bacterium]
MESGGPEWIQVNCPLCGSPDSRLRYPASKGKGEAMTAERFRCTSTSLSRHGDIVQCNRCRLLFSNPQLHPGQVLDIYRAVEDPLYQEEAAARERTFARSLLQLHDLAKPPGRLLDVGCYTGVFMKTAAAAGWKVTGVELSAWAAAIAQKESLGPVHASALEDAGLEAASFDVITLWDVLEHLSRPVAMLENVRRLLKPGGIVAVSTHRVDSFAARILGGRYPFFMDMHLVHFSKPSLERMLVACGFEVLACRRHERVLRLGYFLDRLEARARFLPLRKLFAWLARRRFLRERFIAIGFLGLANVFARKI